MRALTVWLEGIGLLAPGIQNWESAQTLLRGEQTYTPAATLLPTPDLLPAAERRRASRTVKLCLGLGLQACAGAQRQASELPSVFCSSNADGHILHSICDTLAGPDRLISPTRIHNSVHNAASGYWCIATHAMHASQVLAAYDATFSAGLLEAAVQSQANQTPVLMLAYDCELPAPLQALRPIPDAAGIGLVLHHERGANACAALHIRLQTADQAVASARATPAQTLEVSPLTLSTLGHHIPALAGLSVLQAVAKRATATVSLPYLPGLVMQVEVEPC